MYYSVTAPTCAFSYHDGQSKGGGPSLLILAAILLLHIKAAACWVNVAMEFWEMKSCHHMHIAPIQQLLLNKSDTHFEANFEKKKIYFLYLL